MAYTPGEVKSSAVIGRAHDDRDVGGLVDGEVVAEEVQRRDDGERLLGRQLVGALLRVGRGDGHLADFELDRPAGLAGLVVGADAAELLVDVLHGGLGRERVLGERARRVAFGVLEADDDRVARGLQRLGLRRRLDGGDLGGAFLSPAAGAAAVVVAAAAVVAVAAAVVAAAAPSWPEHLPSCRCRTQPR